MTTGLTDLSTQMRSELRWLIRLRWSAAGATLGAGLTLALVTDMTTTAQRLLIVGTLVLLYNTALWGSDRLMRATLPHPTLTWLGVLQIVLDLGTLTVMSLWTGGFESPVAWLFVLHMVIGSLLLSRHLAYGIVAISVVLMFGGLAIFDRWPNGTSETQLALAWPLILLLTVALTNHITANLRASRDRLRHESERVRAVIDTAVDGIVTINDRGIIESVNPAIESIFGYDQSELVDQPVTILMPPPYADEHDTYLRNYMETGIARIIGIGREVHGRRKNGEVFPMDLAVSDLRIAGQRKFTGIIRDISERKEAEAELHRLYEELKRQQEAMIQNEKMVAIGQMAAGVAHEISNPLASMHSLVQLVRRRPERMNEKIASQFDQQVKRISRIVRQLTEFAHPLESQREHVQLNELVTGTLGLLHFDRRLRRVDLSMQLGPEEIEIVVAPQAVQQVLINLITNALDAMEELDDPKLVIRTDADDMQCIIEIADNGPGVAEEHRSRIFEPFFTTKPIGRGTGLGLAISYNLIRSHGGHIDLDSRTGAGSRFIITLPASCDDEQPRAPIPESENQDS